MNNETKWICAMVGAVFTAFAIGMTVEKYQINQCRIALKDKPADEILKVCK